MVRSENLIKDFLIKFNVLLFNLGILNVFRKKEKEEKKGENVWKVLTHV